MSLASMLWALKKAPVENSGEHVVLMAMADYTGDDGCWCFASKETIAADALMSPRTVQRHWSELERRGVIQRADADCTHESFRVIPKRYRPNAWRLRVDKVRDIYCDGGDNLSSLDRGDNPDARGDKRSTSGETPLSPNPSTRTRTRTTRGSQGSRPARHVDSGDYGSPARTIGGTPTQHSTTVARRRPRGPAGPDTAAGLSSRFTEKARAADPNLDPHDISEPALAANISKWMRDGVTAEQIRSDMDSFFASRAARRGDTPLWQRFMREAYRMRQSRKPEPVEDYTEGLTMTTESRFG